MVYSWSTAYCSFSLYLGLGIVTNPFKFGLSPFYISIHSLASNERSADTVMLKERYSWYTILGQVTQSVVLHFLCPFQFFYFFLQKVQGSIGTIIFGIANLCIGISVRYGQSIDLIKNILFGILLVKKLQEIKYAW